jgi:transketolase
MTLLNKNLRIEIAEIVSREKEGHIPSSYSILDIINFLYSDILKFNKLKPKWQSRDYFVLSKGHGALALYVVLKKFGILNQGHLDNYSHAKSILGGHPDRTKVPGAEASTGSLGHGFPIAAGIAMGLKIKRMKNKVITLLGDGECHEGTIWETAHMCNNLNLGNLCAIVDWNGSAKQLLPKDDLIAKWKAFGWRVLIVEGHNENSIKKAFEKINFNLNNKPSVIIAKTTKGKGVYFLEGHGMWHHKVPSLIELNKIKEELS